jgi:hypothetical protein
MRANQDGAVQVDNIETRVASVPGLSA